MSKPILNTNQVDDMKHCIGFDGKRIRRRKYEAYRNYFTTTNDNSSWDEIVRAGLADKHPFPHGCGENPQCYVLNEQGFEFMSKLLGCKIVEGD